MSADLKPIHCPQCGCPPEQHWPEHGRPVTACGPCLDGLVYTTSAVGEGICTWPANEMRKYRRTPEHWEARRLETMARVEKLVDQLLALRHGQAQD